MTVVVLNTTYEPLHTVSVRHAMTMLWRGVAAVLEEGPEMFGPMPRPKVLILTRYVKTAWKYARRRTGRATFAHGTKVTVVASDPLAIYTREGVIKRDHGQCAYCGQPTATTMDHVLPKSRGGATDWANAVAACEYDNWRKGDRTPEEAGMPLLWQPFVPTVYDLTWGAPGLAQPQTRTGRPINAA
ncbi:MAG: HNH endonuclease [Actinobacteria bacterium]|uniref:HNH endonuclease n=1 Tax=Nostocoides veronense TaxID=330836 RepID=A0ABN2LU12_9MICO|nr:HNH endonuclease [Actinomycetota bacterium]